MIPFSETAISQLLGMELIQSNVDGGEVAIADCSRLIQEAGVVHGGLLSTLADSAAVYAIIPHLAEGQAITSIEFKLNFFRPGLADGGKISAKSVVIKTGKKVHVCESAVFQGKKELARGLFTYLTLEA